MRRGESCVSPCSICSPAASAGRTKIDASMLVALRRPAVTQLAGWRPRWPRSRSGHQGCFYGAPRPAGRAVRA
eukprot:scaffold139383_cov401-Phaeocystis_antarctica.AAC.2